MVNMIVIENLKQVYELIHEIKRNIYFTVFEVEKVLKDNPVEALAKV